MSELSYRFEIDESVPLTEAEMSLQLAMIALEGLYGQARVRLEARYHVDERGRALVVEERTAVGEALVRVFASLLIREFGDDSFTVSRSTAGGCAAEAEPAEAVVLSAADLALNPADVPERVGV